MTIFTNSEAIRINDFSFTVISDISQVNEWFKKVDVNQDKRISYEELKCCIASNYGDILQQERDCSAIYIPTHTTTNDPGFSSKIK